MMSANALRRHAVPLALGFPGVAFLTVFFALPVLRLLSLSVAGGTFAPYAEIAGDGFYGFVFWETFRIGAIVTLAAIVIGYPLALVMATAGRIWSTLVLICVLLPFWTSTLVRTYAWMVLLGRDGIMNNVLQWMGLIERPLPLMHNETAVLVGMVHVLTPFFVFPLYAVMRRINPELLLAAEGLGASRWSVFRYVYLPLTIPGVAAGASLVFILAIGFFITPALLGGGRIMMMAVLIEQEIRRFLNWELGGALAFLLLVATLGVYAALNRAARPPQGARP